MLQKRCGARLTLSVAVVSHTLGCCSATILLSPARPWATRGWTMAAVRATMARRPAANPNKAPVIPTTCLVILEESPNLEAPRLFGGGSRRC